MLTCILNITVSNHVIKTTWYHRVSYFLPHDLTSYLMFLSVVPVWSGTVPERGSLSDSAGPPVSLRNQGSQQGQGATQQENFHIHWSRSIHQLFPTPPTGEFLFLKKIFLLLLLLNKILFQKLDRISFNCLLYSASLHSWYFWLIALMLSLISVLKTAQWLGLHDQIKSHLSGWEDGQCQTQTAREAHHVGENPAQANIKWLNKIMLKFLPEKNGCEKSNVTKISIIFIGIVASLSQESSTGIPQMSLSRTVMW